MNTFLFGLLGALLALGLLAGGGVIGWKARGFYTSLTAPKAQKPEEEERRRLIEQQQAFRQLQNYSAERAYGMVNDDSMEEHG